MPDEKLKCSLNLGESVRSLLADEETSVSELSETSDNEGLPAGEMIGVVAPV